MSEEALQATRSPFEGLLFSVFQRERETESKGLVIALTSSQPGEGVSYLVAQLTELLINQTRGRVLVVDLTGGPELESVTPLVASPSTSRSASSPSSFTKAEWYGSWQYRRDLIAQWRAQFEYVLIDCPSNSSGGEAIAVAQHVDGIVLVVEANRTTRQQLQRAEQQLEIAGGNILGYVLNKRRYLIPTWLFRHL